MGWHYYNTQTQSSLHILAAAAALLVLILCSQSSLICGQPLPEYNIANSFSIISWTNINNMNYSYVPNHSDEVGLSTWAILIRQINSSTSFACGLICDDYLGTTCLFGVLLSKYFYYNPPRNHQYLMWSANRNHPVTVNASVELRRDRGLFLMDSDGALVWSTQTNSNGSRSVSGLNLTENGNLVIFGKNNETIWQSFDSPVHVIPPKQVNGRPMELIRGSISTSEDWVVPLSGVLLFLQSSIDNYRVFGCGLICDDLGTTCLFGVLLLQDIPNELKLDYQSLVWSANRNHPVTVNASVELRPDGGLFLMDSNGSEVWSTHTSGNPAVGLNLTGNGNLVIFGKNNETIWQSFDHPTDTLLSGQVMRSRQTLNLTASISTSIFEEGSYSLSVGDDYSVHAYLRSSNAYWYEYTPVMGVHVNFSEYWQTHEFLKFEPDGYLRAYGWSSTYGSDVFAPSIGFCGYPLSCGRYGVCDKDDPYHYCNCPLELSFFTQLNQGCSLITPISCQHSQLHILLEMKYTTYIGHYLLSDEFGDYTDLEGCKQACLRNCSCKAAHFNGSSKGYCLLLNDVLSLVTGKSNNTVYLKVQNSSTLHMHSHPWILQRHAKTILGTTGASVAVVLTIIAIYLSMVRKKKVQLKDEEEFLDGVPGLPTRFSYQDLSAMTQNFSRKLGEGGFGYVFEGVMRQGTKIAVKLLKEVDQIKSSFLAEVATLGSMDHTNLVKLIGFCAAKSQRLLVYEHMANGSLDKWIFNGKQQQEHGLTWQTKKKIMLDVAKGLAYLHEDCNHKIIHLDIKPQNILLDQNFNAKVADFGLSKLVAKDQSKVVTTMRGTPGYIAPECTSLIITEKVDVYSFGIVMIEIVCGRKNVDWDQAEEEVHLLSVFKRKIEEDKVGEMFDMYNKDLEVQKEEGIEMMRIAGWCLQSDYTKRPSMSEVVKALQGLATVDNNINLDYNFSNQEGEAVPDATSNTELIPSILSGPR